VTARRKPDAHAIISEAHSSPGGAHGRSAIIAVSALTPAARPKGEIRSAKPEGKPVSYYKRHVFFCCNQREAPEKCCAEFGATEMQKYAKDRVKALGLNGEGKVRMNKSGCLDRCEEGPVLVVYPEAVWYTYVDRTDIDEIIDRHVVNGEIVERLKI
jgi:(2Fe-2S) ferredoxin